MPLVERASFEIPDEYKIYDSYAVDPQWQVKWTIIWTSVLAFATLVSLPSAYRQVTSGRYYSSLFLSEQSHQTHPVRRPASSDNAYKRLGRRLHAICQSVALWTPPLPSRTLGFGQVGDCCRKAYLSLGIGQLVLVSGYIAASIACLVVGAQLMENSNRPGFIALAHLPVIMLLSMKSPLPIPLFLPTLSYEHYNFLHRWAGRTLFLLVTVHGSMWLHQYIQAGQWDQVWSTMSKTGMWAYAMMCGIILTSLKPIRRKCYQLFWAAHIVLFVAFFTAISYHTTYSRKWVYASVGIYAYDFTVRMLRYRLKDATLVPVNKTMTMIHIADFDSGWSPTQHVFLRVLNGVGVFESHPFTICSAPSSSHPSSAPTGLVLYAKVSGDWTRRLHSLASNVTNVHVGDDIEEHEAFLEKITSATSAGTSREEEEAQDKEDGVDGVDELYRLYHPGKKVAVTVDGPYGGLKIDLALYSSVLVVAGGSGITFALGTIEEAIISRVENITIAWVVRDMSTLAALAPTLRHLYIKASKVSLRVQYDLYLSVPPSPLPTVPQILPAGTLLQPYRPEVAQLVRSALANPTHSVDLETNADVSSANGLAVVACGPEGLVMEARNAVATLRVGDRVAAGGVEFHGECYAL